MQQPVQQPTLPVPNIKPNFQIRANTADLWYHTHNNASKQWCPTLDNVTEKKAHISCWWIPQTTWCIVWCRLDQSKCFGCKMQDKASLPRTICVCDPAHTSDTVMTCLEEKLSNFVFFLKERILCRPRIPCALVPKGSFSGLRPRTFSWKTNWCRSTLHRNDRAPCPQRFQLGEENVFVSQTAKWIPILLATDDAGNETQNYGRHNKSANEDPVNCIKSDNRQTDHNHCTWSTGFAVWMPKLFWLAKPEPRPSYERGFLLKPNLSQTLRMNLCPFSSERLSVLPRKTNEFMMRKVQAQNSRLS